jgi:hypothetical protein
MAVDRRDIQKTQADVTLNMCEMCHFHLSGHDEIIAATNFIRNGELGEANATLTFTFT